MSNDRYKGKLLPINVFIRHLVFSALTGLTVIVVSLFAGMWGYHHFEGMGWIDSFVNAAMILSGMGPMGNLQTDNGKLFAGFYALYSGLALILIVGIIFAPVIRRFLHKFHLDIDKKE